MMQESEFSKMRDCSGFLQIRSPFTMTKHNTGAEKVGHALCADKIFSRNLQFLPITSSSVNWLSEHATNYQWITIGS